MKLFVFKNEKDGKTWYSVFMTNQEKDTHFFKVIFPKGKEITKSEYLKIDNAFFSFESYINKTTNEKVKNTYLVITDYSII
jgi:hypothetical protein